MLGVKRRRKGSVATPRLIGHGNSSQSSSVAQSRPNRQQQYGKHLAKQPTDGVSLRASSSRSSTATAPSHQPSVHRRTRFQSADPPEESLAPEDDTTIHEREDADSLNEIIMCIDRRERGTVGCCYYVARDQKLFVMTDVACSGVEVMENLRLSIQPTIVLLSTRADEVVEGYFNPEGTNRSSNDHFASSYIIEFRPSPEFGYETGKHKLMNLNLAVDDCPEVSFVTPGYDDEYSIYEDGNAAGFSRRQSKLMRLSAWVDMESRLTVGCAGALLTYLGRKKAVEHLPSDVPVVTSFHISTVEVFSLQGVMFVNTDTLASLQILQAESNPNTHNQGPTKLASGSKEGLSVYGLFQRLTKTPQGKGLLRQYFLRPSMDAAIIDERLETVGVFIRADNDNPMERIVKGLGQIKNIRTVMIHLRKGISNGSSKGGGIKNGVWSSLRAIRDAIMEIVDVNRLTIGTKVLESFDTHTIAMIGRAISEKIDFTLSAEMHRTVINAGVDLDLDEMKRSYDGLDDLLNQTSLQVAATVPAIYDLDLNVIFFPQIGFLISIPNNPATGRGDYEGGVEEGRRWDRIFSTPSRIYYKDTRMRGLDHEFGDIYAVICDREIEIVHELGQRVLEQEAMLSAVSDICGELDSLMALAQGAKLYKFCRPRIIESNIIDIEGGRHPLQELTVPFYVPNNTFLLGGSGSNSTAEEGEKNGDMTTPSLQRCEGFERCTRPNMLMMTGPNYSGKSVYLKQVALIVYMAHVGCFVPADRATIGLTDKILTRIATRETVSRFQSAFMIDLQQVALAMTLATHRSLVVVDEFGKGTESNDGAGLACGVFEYFLGLKKDRPKVLGATHFHEIFENGFLPRRPSLAFGYMEVCLDKGAQDIEGQITYLYNFRAGRSTTSYGSCCAALNGVDASVVNRANELVELSAKGEDLVSSCASVSPEEEEDLREAEEMAREFLARDLRQTISNDRVGSIRQAPRDVLTALVETADSVQPVKI